MANRNTACVRNRAGDEARVSHRRRVAVRTLVAVGLLAVGMGCGSRAPAAVDVLEGTYGGNCGAPRGNVTPDLAASCTGQVDCRYVVQVSRLGDPAAGCAKSYVAIWRCGDLPMLRRTEAPPEAGTGATIELSCR